MPGGLAVIAGPTFGQWKLLRTVGNMKTEPLVFNESISRKTGYKKDIIHSVQHNWQIGAQWQKEGSAGLTIEKVFTASLKKMFSFSITYGGCAGPAEPVRLLRPWPDQFLRLSKIFPAATCSCRLEICVLVACKLSAG